MTGIRRFFVAIIAAFSRPNHTVAATIDGAICFAGVLIQGVAIIAGLVARIAFSQTTAQHTVAATSWEASVQAGIIIDLVAIITGLSLLKDAISAAREAAVVRAAIGIVFVTVIAVLDPEPNQAIAAFRREAASDTGVVIGLVAVVAPLEAKFTFR